LVRLLLFCAYLCLDVKAIDISPNLFLKERVSRVYSLFFIDKYAFQSLNSFI